MTAARQYLHIRPNSSRLRIVPSRTWALCEPSNARMCSSHFPGPGLLEGAKNIAPGLWWLRASITGGMLTKLMTAVRPGTKPVAHDLVRRHGSEIMAVARRYSTTHEDAEDAYQRGLEILLTKAPSTESMTISSRG